MHLLTFNNIKNSVRIKMNHSTHTYFSERVGGCQNVLSLLLVTRRLQNYQVSKFCH